MFDVSGRKLAVIQLQLSLLAKVLLLPEGTEVERVEASIDTPDVIELLVSGKSLD